MAPSLVPLLTTPRQGGGTATPGPSALSCCGLPVTCCLSLLSRTWVQGNCPCPRLPPRCRFCDGGRTGHVPGLFHSGPCTSTQRGLQSSGRWGRGTRRHSMASAGTGWGEARPVGTFLELKAWREVYQWRRGQLREAAQQRLETSLH